MKNLKIILFVLLSLSINACGGNQQADNGSDDHKSSGIFLAGKISEKINCRSNSDFSYSLYLPGSFDAGRSYPLILVFDAQARGKMAVERFKHAAESYGYIVVASNDARNGIPDINPIVNAIWDDVVNRFPIDKSRIYTAGFSGGARIASSVAIFKGGVKGVISCGGGMPSPGQEIRTKFDFISIVGLNDFNYQEIKTLDKALTDNDFVCQSLNFNGGHEWPDSTSLSKAVAWLDLMAMKQKKIPVNDNLVREYTTYYADTINKSIISGENYQAYLLYNILIKDLDGLYDISDYKKSYQALLQNPQIEINKNMMDVLKKEELDKQEQLLGWFKTAAFSSIKKEINLIQKQEASGNDVKLHQAKRLLGFMGMLSFLYTESSLNSQNKEKYDEYMAIYEILEPKNPDIQFFKACQSAMENQTDKALEYLQKAIVLGFYDVNRMQTIGYFQELRAKPEFDILVQKAHNNFKNQH